jgi:hypothetical protein
LRSINGEARRGERQDVLIDVLQKTRTVPENEWSWQRHDLLDDSDVGVTYSCCHQLYEHFIVARRLESYGLDREGRMGRAQNGCFDLFHRVNH